MHVATLGARVHSPIACLGNVEVLMRVDLLMRPAWQVWHTTTLFGTYSTTSMNTQTVLSYGMCTTEQVQQQLSALGCAHRCF